MEQSNLEMKVSCRGMSGLENPWPMGESTGGVAPRCKVGPGGLPGKGIANLLLSAGS